MKFNTKTIHGGQHNIDPAYGSVMLLSIKLAPTQTTQGYKGFEYSCSGNSTRSALEKALASRNGEFGLVGSDWQL
jgi:cystathionine beta-lyase